MRFEKMNRRRPYRRSAREVFDAWALDYHAAGMEKHHWPAVQQALARMQQSTGNYLEIGVGNGYSLEYMAKHLFRKGQCYGLDISANMLERVAKRTAGLENVHLFCADFLTWQPPGDLQFSLIFSMEVFYYFPDIQEALDKAAALLQPSGTLLVLVNYFKEHKASHAWPDMLDTPMQLWSSEDYVSGFEKAGLQSVQRWFISNPQNTDSGNPGTLAIMGYR